MNQRVRDAYIICQGASVRHVVIGTAHQASLMMMEIAREGYNRSGLGRRSESGAAVSFNEYLRDTMWHVQEDPVPHTLCKEWPK